MPAATVLGVGAVALPTPPVATVYHNRLVPVAVKAVAVAFWQYAIGVVTVGAPGVAVTFTAMLALGPSHPDTVWLT